MGLTFKENCPDLRNTRVVDMVAELGHYPVSVDVYDPQVNKEEAHHEYGITPIEAPKNNDYDAVIIAVAHDEFKTMSIDDVRALGKDNHIVYDIKYLFDNQVVDGRL
jgi:UDP-N-acetyl-D-galactosamine dehydrogenase